MKKLIKTESFVKKVYTKSEIRYAKKMEWPLVLPSCVPADVFYEYRGWSYRNSNVIEVTVRSKKQYDQFLKNVEKRAALLRSRMPENLDEYFKEIDELEAARKKAARKLERQRDEINKMLHADGIGSILSLRHYLRPGANVGTITAQYGKENKILCEEYCDYENGYAKSCSWTMIRRDFFLNIRRGYHLMMIGGLLTFVKGDKIIREGMPCEWVEQGKSIADIKTVKGFLVRGEHIEAKSLKAAQAINAEHRAMQLARLLSARKKAVRRAEQKANGSLLFTFADSINAGNCRPGTMEFKHKYEEEIGREAKSISIADLRKYGKMFGVEYYAERTIQYALNH